MRQKRDIPRPKKVFLFPEIGRVNIHLLGRIYITYIYIYVCIYIYYNVQTKNKQTNKQKKEPKKQMKLKRKENISGKSIKKKIILWLPG